MHGSLNLNCPELEKKRHEKRKDNEKLFGFINTKVHPRCRKRLIELIEKYSDGCSQCTTVENRLYYKAGFSTAMRTVVTSLKI